tara:strand:- start:265 stop:465 length:201 start_codon:yes stop_codon:yes gene_type:complete
MEKFTMIIKDIQELVSKYPNNMQLGKEVRSYFMDLDEETPYIYESTDGGETVYRRRFGDYGNKEKI